MKIDVTPRRPRNVIVLTGAVLILGAALFFAPSGSIYQWLGRHPAVYSCDPSDDALRIFCGDAGGSPHEHRSLPLHLAGG